MARRCPKCQFIIDDASSTCQYCGEQLRAPSPKQQPIQPKQPTFVIAERYRILQKVSQRRTATVYRARDERTGATVALKRLETVGLVTAADKRRAVAEFQREAARLSVLRHPHIISVLDYWVERETCYLVTSWVEGTTLRQLHDEGPVGEARLRAIGAQLADALAFLHRQEPPIVFRDLKMSHAMLDSAGHACLLDLGLSRFFKPGQARGEAERGTAPYEAPEQQAEGLASPQSDIYALGTLLLALSRGPSGSTQGQQASPELLRILSLARQKDPAKRYDSAAAMRDALAGGVPLPQPLPSPEAARAGIELLTKRLRITRRPGKDEIWYRVRVRNHAEGPLTVAIKPAVAWLVARERETVLQPGDGFITIGARMDMLPHQDMSLTKAVQLSDGSSQWLAVEIVDLEPKLELAQEMLDFGEVADHAAQGPLAISNAGGGVLQVRLTSAVPWLRPATAEATIVAGDTVRIPIHLDSGRAPAAGEYDKALRIDSDFGQAWAGVRFGRARAEMVVEPPSLALGDVRSLDPVELTLAVSNRGTGTLRLRAESGHAAVTVTPGKADVPPRHRLTLHVVLDPAALPPGPFPADRGVRLSGNAGAVDVPITGTIRRPLLAVSERELDFGDLDIDEVAGARRTFVVSNRGNAPTPYRAEPSVAWLQAWPDEGRLDPGSSTVLEASLTTQARDVPGEQTAADALLLRWALGDLPVAARFTLVKPLITIEPVALDFGLIVAGGVSERTVTVANSGSGVLLWEATTDATWIEIAPRSGKVDAGASQSVAIRAYALGLAREAREARAAISFAGPHNRATLSASVAVSRPELVVDPAVDLGTSVDLAPVSARVIVFNRGVGDLTGEATTALPWLEIEPASFAIPSGSSLALVLRAMPPADTGLGEHVLPNAVSISTNAGNAEVEAHIVVVAEAHVLVTPDRLVLKPGGEGTIIVRNVGLGPYRAKVASSAGWLKVSPGLVTIRPGQKARVVVTPELGEESGPAGCIVSIGEGASRQSVEVVVS